MWNKNLPSIIIFLSAEFLLADRLRTKNYRGTGKCVEFVVIIPFEVDIYLKHFKFNFD